MENNNQSNMNRAHNYRTRSAGRLEETTLTMDSNNGANAPPASTGPRGRSINTNEFPGLEQTRGSMPQNQIVRAPSELTCRNPVNEGVQLGVPRPDHKRPNNGNHEKKKEKKQSLLIASLNIRGKQYSNKKLKYKDLMTMMRQRKIALIVLQETKLTEKDKEVIERENPGLAIESNPNDSKAGTAFIINKNIVKWEKQEDRP